MQFIYSIFTNQLHFVNYFKEWLTPIALQQAVNNRTNAEAVSNRAGMNTAAIRVGSNTAEHHVQGSMPANSATTHLRNHFQLTLVREKMMQILTAKNGAKGATAPSWRWFQRRNGGDAAPTSSVSAPATSRQPEPPLLSTSSSVPPVHNSNLSPTISRLWNSLKGSCAPSSSSVPKND